ncbi:MAG: ERAD-associated protein [Candelina submexicana]|nr:MAG: ERAD-associated protein [Candelina submexicana]
MRLRSWRLTPLLIVLTFALVVQVQAFEQYPDAFEPTTQGQAADVSKEQQAIPETFPRHGHNSAGDGKGALDVQEALSILRKLEKPRKRPIRSVKPSGVTGTAVYYAKEAFYLLFMNGPPQEQPLVVQPSAQKLSPPLSKAVKLLERAAEERNPDAIHLLAEMNFYGNYTHPRNFAEAFRRFNDLANLTGNSSAQYMIGFMYGTGIGDAVERDQAKALLYHTFAALGGDVRSEMTVAFRHHAGIGTPRNCEEAAFYYKRVADKGIQYSRNGPPGGQALVREAYSLADVDGGVYGEGASVSSSGVNAIRGGPNSDTHAAFEDVLEYLDLMSRKGDLKATFSLGRLHYEGSRVLNRNLRKAKAYFMVVAKRYWARDGRIIAGNTSDIEKIAAKAAGYLGRMYFRGEGVDQNFEKARIWFKRGIANGDPLCQYSMGLMYLRGLGVPKDVIKASDYFREAADQDFASAQVRLGVLFLDQGDLQTAIRYFELATRHGHIEAYYHLAEMSNQGVGMGRSCGTATTYYKIVAEKAEPIHSPFLEANLAYDDGDKELALIDFMMAAEQGYEVSQANAAYLLDGEKSRISLDRLLPWSKETPSLLRNAALALVYWTRSAKQKNIDSMVKMGDYYLGGFGTDVDTEKAATCYQSAAETHQSALALWNLGWMHENGIGIEQDYHLAKRFYDQALEINSQEAYLPVTLSLLKLRARSFWNTITNGRINSIRSEPEPKKEWSFSEWIHNFIEDEHPYYHDADDDLTDPQIHDPMPGGDDFYDEIDEGVIESLVILVLAAALAFLVYYRQVRQQNHRRTVEQQGNAGRGPAPAAQQGQQQVPGEQADGGFFPPPVDPNFNQWVAGGVGH